MENIVYKYIYIEYGGFPGSSDGKESTCNAGDLGLIPGLGRSPGDGNDNPLQYTCLENFISRGAWRATVHGATKSRTQLCINTHAIITSLFGSKKFSF